VLDNPQQQVGPFKHRPPPQSAFVVQLGVNEQVQRQYPRRDGPAGVIGATPGMSRSSSTELDISVSESGVKRSASSRSRQEAAGTDEASISEVSASAVGPVALGSAADARVAAKATERSTAHARSNTVRVVVGWFIVIPPFGM
jgi:hypothetical protein